MGIFQSLKLSARVRFLEHYISLITVLETEIRYRALSLSQILDRHREDNPLFVCFKECAKEGELPFPEQWKNSAEKIPPSSGLTSEDIRLISEFGYGLGTSDVEGQLSHCRFSTELAKARFEKAREEKQKKSRLYSMLGFFLGIGAVLIIC